MTAHRRLQRTLRSPYRARTLHKRARRHYALTHDDGALIDEILHPAVRERARQIRKIAALVPGNQLRDLFRRQS